MVSYKATYDRGDGNKQDVTVIGVMQTGVVFINNSNGGVMGVDHPVYFTALPYLDPVLELSQSIDNLITEVRAIQTYGLRLNDGKR
jgi:hypothetical protein